MKNIEIDMLNRVIFLLLFRQFCFQWGFTEAIINFGCSPVNHRFIVALVTSFSHPCVSVNSTTHITFSLYVERPAAAFLNNLEYYCV